MDARKEVRQSVTQLTRPGTPEATFTGTRERSAAPAFPHNHMMHWQTLPRQSDCTVMTECARIVTWRPWWLALTVLLALVGLAAPPALSQPTRQCAADQRVRGVDFVGSPLYDDATLAASIATATPTVWQRLHLGEAPCSDSATVALDGLRLAVLHRQAGWLQAFVSVLQDRRDNGVRIRFMITPGPAAILDTLVVEGLPVGADGRTPLAARLFALQRQRFDRVRLDTTLADGGDAPARCGIHARHAACGALGYRQCASRVRATVTFVPGALVTIRAITVDAQGIGNVPSTVTPSEILGLTGLREGRAYRASDVVNAQRSLYRADVFSTGADRYRDPTRRRLAAGVP